MSKILLATKNRGKQREILKILAPLGVDVISLADVVDQHMPDVLEDGKTFAENALKKAEVFHRFYHIPTLADDSGLEVDALGGAPGVYSARYAGEEKNDEANNRKLLANLEGVPRGERKARFTCVLAYVDGDSPPILATGHCEGVIAEQPRGEGGFGYDPLFYLPEKGKTLAEMSAEEKNKISHRYHALQNFIRAYEHRVRSKKS